MSSILDALNKLEQEKAQAARDHEQDELDPAITAHDLVGRSVLRDRVTLRITPMALLLSIGSLVVILIVVAFGAALIFARGGEKPSGQTAAVVDTSKLTPTPFEAEPAPAPVEAPAAATVTETAPPPVEAQSAPAAPAESAPAQTAPAESPVPAETLPSPQSTAFVPKQEAAGSSVTPVTTPTMVARQPESKPEPAAPDPAPEVQQAPPPTVTAAPEPAPVAVVPPSRNLPAAVELEDLEEPAPRTRVAAAPVNQIEDDPPPRRSPPAPKTTAAPSRDVPVDRLPEFTAMEQMKYGFDRVRINMMKPADANNPRGSALITFTETAADGSERINRMRFLEGERLLQTPLRLFKVEDKRIGLEDVRTGDRYQLIF